MANHGSLKFSLKNKFSFLMTEFNLSKTTKHWDGFVKWLSSKKNPPFGYIHLFEKHPLMKTEKEDLHFNLCDVVGNVQLQKGDKVRCVVSEKELNILSVTLINSAADRYKRSVRNASEVKGSMFHMEIGYNDDQNSEKKVVKEPQMPNFNSKKTCSSSQMNTRPMSLFMHKGRVTRVMKNIGFMEPLNDLPSDYPQGENVRFKPKFVKSGGLQIKAGDVLEFDLEDLDKSQLWAVRAYLVAISKRSEREVEDLLESIVKKLFPSDENDFIMQQSMGEQSAENHAQDQQENEPNDTDNEKASVRSQCHFDLMTCDIIWKFIGNCDSMKGKNVDNAIKILLYLEEHSANMQQKLRNIFFTLSETFMFLPQIGTLHQHIKDRMLSGNLVDNLIQVRQFLLHMLHYVPERRHKFLNLIKLMVSKNKDSLDNFLFVAMKEIAKSGCDGTDDLEWCDLPLVPSTRELTDGCLDHYGNVKPAIVLGAYSTSQGYLDTYFRLFRYDCIGNLCKDVQDFLKGKLDYQNMNCYHDVKLIGVSLNENISGLAVMLEMTPAYPVKNWAVSPKLMFGNLLCISPTGTFKDPIWATVIKRSFEPPTGKPCIVVELSSSDNFSNDAEVVMLMFQRSGNMVMVESPTFFLAYKPVLQALLSMDPEKIPFKKELVEGKEDLVKLPRYISEKRSHFKSLDDFYNSVSKTWPECFDVSQLEAMKSTFARRIVCIQGPPATGKTFLGIHIVRSILSLDTCPQCPILVLTHKNRTLNEILKELLVHFPEHVIRIGGHCKELELETRNLNEIKKTTRMNKALYDLYKVKCSEINQFRSFVKTAALAVNKYFSLTPETFATFLSKQQLVSLINGLAIQNKKYAEKSERSVNSLTNLRKEIPTFFSTHKSEMKLLQKAIKHWMPSENNLREEECRYRPFVSIHDLIKVSDATLTDANEAFGDEFTEKDFEDVQAERLAAVCYETLSSHEDIPFQTENGSEYLRLLNYEGYHEQLELSAEFILKSKSLWDMTSGERIKLVQSLLLKQIAGSAQFFKDNLLRFQRLCMEKKELEDIHKVNILKSMKVVAMTMNGASLNADLLGSIKPAIVIVEEAAEILETQILAVLGNWVEHLILIGDHKQLRPQVENYKAASEYNLNISMMERLINNKMPHCSLTIQRRMRPEFAALLLDIYPGLKNGKEVESNMPPSCIEKSMFFWDHKDQEEGDRNYSNIQEAERTVRLALFLMQQGYSYEQITILAAYQGQVATIRQQLRTEQKLHPNLFNKGPKNKTEQDDKKECKRDVIKQVHLIDMYQGEENEIVIVSLVRSNAEKALGLLNFSGRRCVAQSRAKCGLYFIGNADLLSNSIHWQTLIQSLKEQNCFGTQIPLYCPKHPFSKLMPVTGKDMLQTFCEVVCGTKMPCGLHNCDKPCQPPHDHDQCKYPCVGKMHCDRSHQCPENCYPDHRHEFCREMVEFTCEQCGNSDEKMCSQKEIDIKCLWIVNFKKESCNHICERYCYQSEASIICGSICLKSLKCGHPCQKKCGEKCVGPCKKCKKHRNIEDKRRQEEEEECAK